MINLIISKLQVKKGEIEKNENLNISFKEWENAVLADSLFHFWDDLHDWAKSPGAKHHQAVVLSQKNSNAGARLVHNGFWFIIRVEFPNKLEAELIPIIADFAASLNAHLLVTYSKPYPKEKIEEFRKLQNNLKRKERKRYTEAELGVETAWVAIQGLPLQKIVELMGLELIGQTKWDEAIVLACGKQIMVAPPLNDWIVLQGFSLPSFINQQFGHLDDEVHPDNSIVHFLEELTKSGGKAQFYMSSEKSGFYSAHGTEKGKVRFKYIRSEIHHIEEGQVPRTSTDEVDVYEVGRKHGIDLEEYLYLKELPKLQIPLYQKN